MEFTLAFIWLDFCCIIIFVLEDNWLQAFSRSLFLRNYLQHIRLVYCCVVLYNNNIMHGDMKLQALKLYLNILLVNSHHETRNYSDMQVNFSYNTFLTLMVSKALICKSRVTRKIAKFMIYICKDIKLGSHESPDVLYCELLITLVLYVTH